MRKDICEVARCILLVCSCVLIVLLIVAGVFGVILLWRHTFDGISSSNCFWTALGAVGTVGSLVVTAASITRSNKRIKKQATVDAYTNFKRHVVKIENELHDNYNIDKIKEIVTEYSNEKSKERVIDKWEMIKEYLSEIERIAVGVNGGIFDAGTINKMGGYYIYEQYMLLKPIIQYKRDKDKNQEIYIEFTNMVNAIVRCRRKNKQDNLGYVK